MWGALSTVPKLFALAATAYHPGPTLPPAMQDSVSLCIVVADRCAVPGSRVTVAVEVGQSDNVIVGGQFSIHYDPTALDFIEIVPGAHVYPSSPFSLELARTVDEQQGEVFYAVGIVPGQAGTHGPEVMAQLGFVVRGGPKSEVCLVQGAHPNALVNEDGQFVPIDNSQYCPPPHPYPTLSCGEVKVNETCQCGLGPPDCSVWSDDCNVGVCNEVTAQCEAVPGNEGEACDDGYACTVTDICIDGVCVGSGCTDPSLCVEDAQACLGLGKVTVGIELGEGEPVIMGGQFTIQYDPGALNLIDILPGNECDPASPFALEIYQSAEVANEGLAEVFYAVGVSPMFYPVGAYPGGSRDGSSGPATMACLEFAFTDVSESEVCLIDRGPPLSTKLVDDTGHAVWIYNVQDCPADLAPPVLSCADVVVAGACRCIPGTDDCSGLDTDCVVGICNEQSGYCEIVAVNEGEPCDDGDPCSAYDSCVGGECKGLNWKCPSLCIEADDRCIAPGAVREVAIQLGHANPIIVGGQFSIRYDPTALDFVSMSPGQVCDGSSPFVFEFYESVDDSLGKIFYAVGVAIGDPGTQGPATLACLSFVARGPSKEGVCLFNDLNPFSTVLVTNEGQAAPISNLQDCPVDRPLPVISCDNICTDVPTLDQWGAIIMALFLLTAAKIRFGTRVQV